MLLILFPLFEYKLRASNNRSMEFYYIERKHSVDGSCVLGKLAKQPNLSMIRKRTPLKVLRRK